MATDYEQYYRENKQGLGAPTKEFVVFFETYKKASATVLDIGCGQGRDAVFIARLGHNVTALDISPTGISDLQKIAASEGLNILAKVADVREYTSNKQFDVIVVDRTLHMLGKTDRLAVLENLLSLASEGGHVLIADERSNFPAFKEGLARSPWNWTTVLERQGFLFVRRD